MAASRLFRTSITASVLLIAGITGTPVMAENGYYNAPPPHMGAYPPPASMPPARPAYPPVYTGQNYGRPGYGPGYRGSRFGGPFSRSGFGPWNNRGSGFRGPWNNRGNWGDFRNPFAHRSPGSWMNPNKNNMSRNWDDMLNAPSRMGRMPGGWEAPSVSMPNPIDVGDEFSDAARDLPDQMNNFRYNN